MAGHQSRTVREQVGRSRAAGRRARIEGEGIARRGIWTRDIKYNLDIGWQRFALPTLTTVSGVGHESRRVRQLIFASHTARWVSGIGVAENPPAQHVETVGHERPMPKSFDSPEAFT
jgi:hypothetical protein